jgi:sarcosine oxidase, subunit gamma
MASALARIGPSVVATAYLVPLPSAARFILRGGDAVLAAAGQAFGVALPATACRASSNETRAALWLGPDEQLLLAPDGERAAIASELERALAAHAHSLVDVSHRQTALRVFGRHAALLLNSHCPLDLDPETFPVGMCTRTLFGKAEIVLWRRADTAFHVEIWRSFTDYLVELLAEAARELGP